SVRPKGLGPLPHDRGSVLAEPEGGWGSNAAARGRPDSTTRSVRMPGQLWLMRHGETEWSRSGAHTGRTDLPLSEVGRDKAIALGRPLSARQFALVLTSPLARARETCRLAGYGDVAQIEPNLCEWDYGDYEGRSTPDIRKEAPNWSLWTSGVPNGETIEQVSARAQQGIRRAPWAPPAMWRFSHTAPS